MRDVRSTLDSLRTRLSRPLYVFLILFFPIFLGIYAKLFFGMDGYLSWGNYAFPLASSQLLPQSIFWNPFTYGGTINPVPYANALNLPVDYLQYYGSEFMGTNVVGKLFVLSTSLLLSYSFYLFAGQFSKNLLARVCATAFFAFNPLQLMLYAYGDFLVFVYQCMLIIGLFILVKGLRSDPIRWAYVLVAEAVFTLSIPFFEAFYIGLLLFALTGLYSICTYKRTPYHELVRRCTYFLTSLLLIVPLAAPLLTSYIGSYSALGPQSSFAPSVADFIASSSSPADLLTLHGYPPNLGWQSAAQGLGPAFYFLWAGLWGLLIGLLLSAYVLTSRRRFLYYPLVILAASFVGANGEGPLAAFNLYLYQNVPGYQVLAQSYFWDWILISFLYAQCLAELISVLSSTGIRLAVGAGLYGRVASRIRETLRRADTGTTVGQPASAQTPVCANSSGRGIGTRSSRPGRGAVATPALALALIVVITCGYPIVTQGYYTENSTGIHANSLPSGYATLPVVLSRLVNGTYAGVAFLPPDSWAYYNQSLGFENPLVSFPTYRVAETPGYRTPSNLATPYLLWVYQEFYENKTRYFPELMSLAGYDIYVVLESLNGGTWPYFAEFAGENASLLMTYQVGVHEVTSGAGYSIYESNYTTQITHHTPGYTLVLGGYSLLNEAAYAGINLTGLAIVFGSSLTSSDSGYVLGHLAGVISAGDNGVLDFAFATDSFHSVNLAQLVQPYYSPNGWYSSQALYSSDSEIPSASAGPLYSTPKLFAMATGEAIVRFSVQGLSPGRYAVYADTLLSPTIGGVLRVSVNGNSILSLNTSTIYDNEVDGFNWLNGYANITSTTNTVSIESLKGTNAIAGLEFVPVVENPSLLSSTVKEIEDLGAPIASIVTPIVSGSAQVSPQTTGAEVPFTSATATGSLLYLARSDLQASAPSFDVSTPFPVGTAYMQLLNLSGGFIQSSYSNGATVGFGYNSRNGVLSSSDRLYWLQVPDPYQNTTYINLTVTYGYVYIGEIVVTSTPMKNFTSFDVRPFAMSTFQTTLVAPWVSNFTYEVSLSSAGELLTGSLVYSDPNGTTLAQVSCLCHLPSEDALGVVFNTSASVSVSINGTEFLGNSNGSTLVVPGPLYLGMGSHYPIDITLRIPAFFGISSLSKGRVVAHFSVIVRGLAASYNATVFDGVSDSVSSVRVSITGLGYQLVDPGHGILIVRIPYVVGERISTNGSVVAVPLVGGAGTAIEFLGDGMGVISVEFVDPTPFYVSLAIPPLTLGTSLIVGAVVLPQSRGRTSRRRNRT